MAPKLTPFPGSYTTERSRLSDKTALDAIADIAKATVSRFARNAFDSAAMAGLDPGQTDEYRILAEIRDRKSMLEAEQARQRTLFRRMDNLFYPSATTTGGADHWPEGEKEGRVHISVNTPPVYVEIPAALQAVEPVENYVAQTSELDEREATARAERLYFEWKDETEFELKVHQACVVKGLYGFTYGKVYWDPIAKRPTVSVIESPENLYVGWGASDFSRIDWTIYCYGLSPQAVEEDFGLSVAMREDEDSPGKYFPFVTNGDHADPLGNVYNSTTPQIGDRTRSEYEQGQVEVYDYWYKKAGGKGKKPEIWNALYVGNYLVKNSRHREYDEIPYVPLSNTYIPGSPYGRPELYDLEQIFREKDERLTNAAQMIATTTDGQMWQLVGPDAPDDVPANAIPRPNKVATPGPGSEIKALQPFIGQYASEDLLKRLDAELEVLSGLNDFLLGKAGHEILGSSKAMAAIVANYEARISMKRRLLYGWRKNVWRMAAKVWEAKDPKVKAIIDGRYRIEVKPPELTPRDTLEMANIAMSLVQNRIWSMERAMDSTGVEDPTDEKNVIREEQTDPALNPAAVTQQLTLVGTAQSLGMPLPQGAGPSQAQTDNAQRTANPPVKGSQSLNAAENQGNPPPESLPSNARAANGAPNGQGGKAVIQSLTQNGETSGRILTQTPLSGG